MLTEAESREQIVAVKVMMGLLEGRLGWCFMNWGITTLGGFLGLTCLHPRLTGALIPVLEL